MLESGLCARPASSAATPTTDTARQPLTRALRATDLAGQDALVQPRETRSPTPRSSPEKSEEVAPGVQRRAVQRLAPEPSAEAEPVSRQHALEVPAAQAVAGYLLPRMTATVGVRIEPGASTMTPEEVHTRWVAPVLLAILRERAERALASGRQGLPAAAPLRDGWEDDVPRAGANGIHVGLESPAAVEWSLLESAESTWDQFALNPEHRPNVFAEPEGRGRVALSVVLQGRYAPLEGGPSVDDSVCDEGLDSWMEIVACGAVNKQVAAGRGDAETDWSAVESALRGAVDPLLLAHGLGVRSVIGCVIDGGQPYVAAASNPLLSDAMTNGDGSIDVVAAADASEVSIERPGNYAGGKSGGDFTSRLVAIMRKHPHLGVLECAKLIKVEELSQTPESTSHGGDTPASDANANKPQDPAADVKPKDQPGPEQLAKVQAALCFGASRYRSAPLPGAANDAKAIASTMAGRHYRTRLVENPHGPLLRAELGMAAKMAEPGSKLFIYFSGHGSKASDKREAGLIGVDGDVVPYTWIYQLLAALKAKDVEVELVLDCCHSGQMNDTLVEGVEDSAHLDEDQSPRKRSLLHLIDETEALGAYMRAHRAGYIALPDARRATDGTTFSETARKHVGDRLPWICSAFTHATGRKIVWDNKAFHAANPATVTDKWLIWIAAMDSIHQQITEAWQAM